MSTVAEIERAIKMLSPDEFSRLREWFAALDSELWDKQFESDAKSGRLDALADEATSDFDAGNCKEL